MTVLLFAIVVSPALFGSDRYSKEELTAEMGAAFLCAVSGIDTPVIENQTAYISGWLKQIRNGTAADVVRAARDAQRAVDYLTGEVG
jgi:antirestriction protein ArdC